jgi:hypothetical protein
VWFNNGRSGIINIGERGRVDFTSGGKTVTVEPGYFSVAREGEPPSVPMEHHLNQQTASEAGGNRGRHLDVATVSQAPGLPIVTSADGLAEALASVEHTLLREGLLQESPIAVLQAMKLDTQLMTTLAGLIRLTTAGLENTATVDGTVNGTNSTTVLGQVRVDVHNQDGSLVTLGAGPSMVTAAVGSVSVGPTTVGPVSVGPVSVAPLSTTPLSIGPISVGPVAVGPLSVGPTALGPVSVGPLTAAPTVTLPAVTLPSVTVAPPTVVPIAPVTIAPVTVIPTAPVITVPVTPPAVISGALGILK